MTPTEFLKNNLSPKFYSKIYVLALNLWPCIRGTGGWITFISEDFTKLTVRLKLSLRTRNVVGTIFGGSMYASTDPMFMLMLINILGPDFVVWDKGCTTRFKRPAKGTIYAHFEITPEMLEDVRKNVFEKNEYTFTWNVAYKDDEGVVYSEFDKVLYVANKDFYNEKLKARLSSH